MSKHIELHIDRIVIEGHDYLNQRELDSAIRQQLVSMLAEQGLPENLLDGGYYRKRAGGTMILRDHPATGQVGNDIAHGIIRGLNSEL